MTDASTDPKRAARKLRRRFVTLYYLGAIPAALPLWFLGGHGWPFTLAWSTAWALGHRRAWSLLLQRKFLQLSRKINRALDEEDFAAARSAVEELEAVLPGFAGADVQRALSLSTLFVFEERFTEALALFEGLVGVELSKGWRTVVDINHAWALAHVGESERSLALIEAVIARAPTNERAGLDLHHGAILALAGRHAEAVPVLLRAKAVVEPGREATSREFHLGLALAGLGRHDEARQAFARAAAGFGCFAERARAKLEDPAPPPYR
jgi:tetratricopeptide (TPR) repeat protein